MVVSRLRERGFERLEEPPACFLQFRAVGHGEFSNDSFRFSSQTQNYLAAVRLAAHASNKAVSFQPVAQFHRTVMLDLQALREHSHCRLQISRESLDGQQRLMLVRFNACGAGRLLAIGEVPANFVTKIREHFIIDRSFSRHTLIISYYDRKCSERDGVFQICN